MSMLKIVAVIVLILVTIMQSLIPLTMLGGYLVFYFLFKEKEKPKSYTKEFHDRLNRAILLQKKNQYLNSPQWKTKRLKVFHIYGYACQICHSEKQLECHHITYERLGNEKLSDLACLCRNCHQNIHDKLGYDLTITYPIGV